jgi:hypothetical protein
MIGTRHTGGVGLDEHPHRAGIQRPPPAPPLTLVAAAAASPALTASTCRTPPQPTRHHNLVSALVELDRLDDDVTFDADHPPPYPLRLHPVARRSTSSRRQLESQAGQRGAPADGQPLTHGTGRRANLVCASQGPWVSPISWWWLELRGRPAPTRAGGDGWACGQSDGHRPTEGPHRHGVGAQNASSALSRPVMAFSRLVS